MPKFRADDASCDRSVTHCFDTELTRHGTSMRRSTLSVCVCVSVQSCQSFCGEDEGFHDKDKGFLAKMKDFLFFVIFAKNPSSLLQCLSMCRHANGGIPSTEHVQKLHWACADIIMRGNPMTDMTDNTETQTQTDGVYTLNEYN